MGKLLRQAIVLGTLALPYSAYAAAPKNFKELADSIGSIIDTGTGVLIVLGFAVYFWGISTNILKFEDDPEKRKAYFIWGILVLFVMVSIWGIIGLIGNTLFGSGLGFTGSGSSSTVVDPNPFTSDYVGIGL